MTPVQYFPGLTPAGAYARTMNPHMSALRVTGLGKTIGRQNILVDVTLEIAAGDFVAVRGPSGAGKTTLLNILGLLDDPTHGEYRIGPDPTGAWSEARKAAARNRTFGYVFQGFLLHQHLTALENVARPLRFRRLAPAERRDRARAALPAVGLAALVQRRPGELSGGEQQRVAIARALVGEPGVILADEPTGNLPKAQWEPILDLLAAAHARGASVVLVTHDDEVASRAQREVRLSDGRLEGA